jgi:hypothetical protein
MATNVCSKCGASLTAGAKSCPSCGQAVPAALTAPAPAKLRPAMAIAVLGAGLILVIGAFALFKSGMLSGTPTPADTAAIAAPVATGATVTAPGQAVTIEAQKSPAGAAAAPGSVQPSAGQPAILPAGAAPAAAGAAPEAPPPPFSKTYECKESAVFNVSPEEAKVTVDGHMIGTADDWDDMAGGKKYEFKGHGVHYVKLSLGDYETLWLRFIVKPDAEHKTADVNLSMKKQKKEE